MHYKYCFQENGQPCIKWRPVLVTVGGISTNLHVPFFFSFIFLFWSHFQPIGIKLQVLSTLRLRGVCLSSGIYTSTILLNVFKTPQRSFACLALESFFFSLCGYCCKIRKNKYYRSIYKYLSSTIFQWYILNIFLLKDLPLVIQYSYFNPEWFLPMFVFFVRCWCLVT